MESVASRPPCRVDGRRPVDGNAGSFRDDCFVVREDSRGIPITLGELIPDPNGEEPMEGMDRSIQKEHLGGWLSQLNEREQKILKLRFGLGGEEPLTLAEIGRQINVSRERVRQLEAKAILKLRAMTNHQQAA